MQRKENESFESYKARRAEVQRKERLSVAHLRGGSRTSREMRRHPVPIVIDGKVIDTKPMRGSYGADLRASFARNNPNLRRNLLVHKAHVAKMAARKAAPLALAA